MVAPVVFDHKHTHTDSTFIYTLFLTHFFLTSFCLLIFRAAVTPSQSVQDILLLKDSLSFSLCADIRFFFLLSGHPKKYSRIFTLALALAHHLVNTPHSLRSILSQSTGLLGQNHLWKEQTSLLKRTSSSSSSWPPPPQLPRLPALRNTCSHSPLL